MAGETGGFSASDTAGGDGEFFRVCKVAGEGAAAVYSERCAAFRAVKNVGSRKAAISG
jgi:hypothetical protein